MKVYLIQHKQTKLFANPGKLKFWDDCGKTWTNIGHVKNHARHRTILYTGCQIVECEFHLVPQRTFDMAGDLQVVLHLDEVI